MIYFINNNIQESAAYIKEVLPSTSTAVSFSYASMEYFADNENIIYWRNFLNIKEEIEYTKQGHSVLSDMIQSVPSSLSQLLTANFHELGRLSFMSHVLSVILRERPEINIIVDSTVFPSWLFSTALKDEKKSSDSTKLLIKQKAPLLFMLLKEFGFLLRKRFLSTDKNAQLENHPTRQKKAIVINVEDSGTNVNLVPCQIIANQSQQMGFTPIVVTSGDYVLKSMQEQNICSVKIPYDLRSNPLLFHLTTAFYSVYLYLKFLKNDNLTIRLIANSIISKIHNYKITQINSTYKANQIYEDNDIVGHLEINSGLPSGIWFSQLYTTKSIKSVAYNCILIFDHPETAFFPSPFNLTYGDHAKKIIENSGNVPSSVVSVGSVVFDQCKIRSHEKDLDYVKSILPNWNQRKLVTIGTECRPGEKQEIQAVVNTLINDDDTHIVLKLHPSDSKEFFNDIIQHVPPNKLTAVEKCDLDALLNISDLLVCLKSNIIINAALLDTPTLSCKFSEVEHEPVNFAEEGISEGCFDPNDLANKINEVLHNSEYRNSVLERMRNNIYKFNGLNDSKSAQRIVEYITS